MTYMTEYCSKKPAKKQNQAIGCDNVQKELIIDMMLAEFSIKNHNPIGSGSL